MTSKKIELQLYKKEIQVFPLGESNFYVIGGYKICNSPSGLVSFNSWVASTKKGVGMISVQIDDEQIIYLRTLDILVDENSNIQHQDSIMTVCGGGFTLQDIYYGTARMFQRGKCIFMTIKYNIMTPGVGSFSQLQQSSLLLENKKVYKTTIEPGNLKSAFRVGTFDVSEVNSGVLVGTLLFEVFDISLNSGFGIHAFDLKNQIFFNMFNSFYEGSILDPFVHVKNVVGSTVGGQKFNRYLKNGYFNFENFSGSLDEVYNIWYCNQLLPTYSSFETLDLVATDKQVFVYTSLQIQGSIRIGQFSLRDNVQGNIIGVLYFQTYIVSDNTGMGLMVFELNGRGCIFNQFRATLTDPLSVTTSVEITSTLVGGTKDFEKLDWGVANFQDISPGTDQNINIIYHCK